MAIRESHTRRVERERARINGDDYDSIKCTGFVCRQGDDPNDAGGGGECAAGEGGYCHCCEDCTSDCKGDR